jgi:subtilisin family serine protease
MTAVRTRRLPLALILVAITHGGLSGRASEPEPTRVLFAPGQVIVEFGPDVILLDPDPRERFIPLENVPIALPGLRASLDQHGITAFEVFARHWRAVDPDPPWNPAEIGYVPAMLHSFRNTYVLHFPPLLTPPHTMVDALSALPGVRTACRNPILRPTTEYWPTDTLLGCPTPCNRNYQWNTENIGGSINGVECAEGFDVGLRGAYEIQSLSTKKIALMDTGVDDDHPDLTDNLDYSLGRNFAASPPDSLAWDDVGYFAGHGTAAAGIIGAVHSADSSVVGICGRCEQDNPIIVPMKIWSDSSAPDSAACLVSWLVDALDYTAAQSAVIPIAVMEVELHQLHHDTTNVYQLTEEEVEFLGKAIQNGYNENLFLAAAAGNKRPSQHGTLDVFPAGYHRMVVGVTAVGCDSSKEANFYKGRNIDLSAPGHADDGELGPGYGQIVTTKVGGGYKVADGDLFTGTSAAVPHVGGIAGLLLSNTPALTNEDLEEVLVRTASDLPPEGYDTDFGFGLVRADDALTLLDDYVLVHDSTSTGTWSSLSDCRQQDFSHITILASPWRAVTDWESFKVERYKFDATVSLTQNQNPQHVPQLWVRGRESNSVRDTVDYNGLFEPYDGVVVSVSNDEAHLRALTYKIFTETSSCEEDSFVGWFPVDPYAETAGTILTYSYLADSSSGDDQMGRAPSGTTGGVRTATITRSGRSMTLSFSAPSAEGGALSVFDVTGRCIQRMAIPSGSPGRRTVQWESLGGSSGQLARGIYHGRLAMGGTSRPIRIFVLR